MNQSNVKPKIDQILFAFFSERFSYQDKSTFLSELKKKNIFSGAQETILPIPEDAPPDIPIMFLAKVNAYEIRFFRNRIDYISLQDNDENHVYSAINDIYSALKETPKNVGLVIYSSFDGINEDEINSKTAMFFSEAGKEACGIDDQSSELLLRNLRKKNLDIRENQINTNITIAISTAKKINSVRKIAVEFDINTFPSDGIRMDKEFINAFIKKTFDENRIFVNNLITKVLTV